MRNLLLLLAIACSTPALGQTVSPLTRPATQNDIAAIQAQIPQPSDAVPMPDMATAGAIGSSPRYRRPDDQAPRISRTVSGTTGTAGTAAVTWAAMPSVPKLTVTPYVGSAETLPARCYPVVGTITTTGATIKCYRDRALLALLQLPAEVAPAGIQFDVLVLPGS